ERLLAKCGVLTEPCRRLLPLFFVTVVATAAGRHAERNPGREGAGEQQVRVLAHRRLSDAFVQRTCLLTNAGGAVLCLLGGPFGAPLRTVADRLDAALCFAARLVEILADAPIELLDALAQCVPFALNVALDLS